MPAAAGLDRQTIDDVLLLLAPTCRTEVVAALDGETDVSIGCKQDIQAALSGYNRRDAHDAVPVVPDAAFEKHTKTAIGLVAAALVFIAARLFSRRRRGADAKKKTNKKKKK
ncbi:hypothetical protein M885DRAFT_613003 [Pelagophyceae sp. CCMP2097]|nr:hypothetical protein M885DRAFT_613003 [Pelagophyceae sp. CCMP2097]|eukprot:CAMPEP_0206807716 /NCGR_PEP_ID=MMETSP0975-20121206/5373_1 /ASSEMBLY_ACC=CAM_ASM_000399 /TAXON_ID=483370 /ORGANISM="non described non described, Strain CCMP2097" /LENGTH=111 /DNA_ID=CAMNT_0054349791 /DNA_START=18 /DNA_END=353 /DNA_ORIENTATION=+